MPLPNHPSPPEPDFRRSGLVLALLLALALAGCAAQGKFDPSAEAPPPNVKVEHAGDAGEVHVEHPEQFPVVEATAFDAKDELTVTGVVADVSRAVPVVSLAAGRVLEVHARLGDTVQKGQLLMRIQSVDVANAFSDYRQAQADQTLAQAQLERAKTLLERGAIAQKDYEIAVDAAAKARVTLENTAERIRVMGADIANPSSVIDVVAPVSGVITDQQITQSAGVQGLASPNPFTISDLSTLWVLCDVFENDLRNVQLGEQATVKLNALPDLKLSGRVSNIGPALDPNLRTAKVRIEIKNPGMMRVGMFVSATFMGAASKKRAAVPAGAILHLHDRDWVYVPAGGNAFRRVEVAGGRMLPSGMQEIVSGIAPGAKVVANALVLQNTTEQ